jgi:hypothetical protein
MKKTLLLLSLSIIACMSAIAQNIVNPAVERADDLNCTISKIETTDKYTIVSFDYTAPSDNSWVQLNKEIFIKADGNDKRYAFVKAENMTMAPEKRINKNAGDNFTFKAYFQKIPKNTKSIDVIENPEGNNSSANYFNYYNVSLTQSQRAATYAYTMSAPSARIFGGSSKSNLAYSYNVKPKVETDIMLSDLKAEAIRQLAKQQKEYFDALVKEGFTEDQAIRIMTAAPTRK